MYLKKEELLKELLEKKYHLPLSKIDIVDLILSETNCKTIEDCEKVHEYIKWYSKNCIKTGHKNWLDETTVELYYDYLKAFKDINGRELFPKRDMYYLVASLGRLKKRILKEEVYPEYDKTNGRMWDQEVWDKENEVLL